MLKFIFFKILFMSAAFTASGALVILCEKAFSKVMSRRTLFRLWLVPLILSLVPVAIPVPVSLSLVHFEQRTDFDMEHTPKTDENIVAQPVQEYQVNVNAAAQLLLADPPAEKLMDEKHIDIDLILILAYIYFTCALFIIAAHIIGAIRFSLKFRTFAAPCENDIPAWLLKRAGVRRQVALFSAEGSFSPFVYGVFRPKITIPEGNVSQEALLHELIHIRRNDLLFLSVMNFVKAVHFFNPFTYVYSTRMKKAMELSCDEDATSKMNNEERLSYSKCRIGYSAPLSRSAAYLSENGKYLKERIDLVMKNRERGKCAKIITLFIVLALVLFQAACATVINSLSPEDGREKEITGKYISFDEAVEIARERAHAEHDTAEYWIDDDYYYLAEENDTAYMISFTFEFLPDKDPDENIGGDYAPMYIIEKGTGNILWSGGGHDHWDGMMDEILSQNSDDMRTDSLGGGYILHLKPCNTYQDILDNVYEYIMDDYTAYNISCDDIFSYNGIGEARGARTVDEALDGIGYTFCDVDGNGIKELIIADTSDSKNWDNRILLMYTLYNNKPVRLIEGWGRNRYYLLNDGTIYNEGSGGAPYTYVGTYRIAKDGISLQTIDFYYSGFLGGYPEDDGSNHFWFYNKTGEVTEDESEIIENAEVANTMMNTYVDHVKDLDLTFFSEYR